MSQIDRYLEQGLLYFQQGEYQKAIAPLTFFIELEADHDIAYFFRGEALRKLENYTAALEDLNKAIALEPEDADYYYLRSCIKEKLEDYHGVISDCDRAIAFGHQDERAYFKRGYAHWVLDNTQEAIADYTKAINLNPDEAFWQRGIELLQHRDDLYANTITSVLSNLIAAELAKNPTPAENSSSWVDGISKKLGNLLNSDRSSTRNLTLIYNPKSADDETIRNPSLADLERVVDELWQEAQYIIQGKVSSRFTGHFILEDNKTQDYIQGMWDECFQPAGGFHLEWSCNGNRSWLPLPKTDSETKHILRLWLEDIQDCSALNWELIGDRDPMSLDHSSRRGFKVIHLLKQYEAGERNFRQEDLSNANLFETDLQGINLAQACLVRADLRGTNLTRANLTQADLSGACLLEADLRSANLSGANLEGAIYDEDTEFPSGFDP
ncbi:MAG: pentapeptide repeat-containing protein, partial [Pleurocapsa sp. MO_192.B19]|nr:pentapeptide repeat-containing protein [Pleurocapsa sp. MO_192.B19]